MSSRTRVTKRTDGFTLIEVIVVISIIGILCGLALAAVQSSRAAMRKAGCANNLRQIGVGLSAHQANFGIFPPEVPPLIIRAVPHIPTRGSVGTATFCLLSIRDRSGQRFRGRMLSTRTRTQPRTRS
jgi:prepilin-type N-terminal cleavage/methylation domain-containing protein